jgi:hypothetical protein
MPQINSRNALKRQGSVFDSLYNKDHSTIKTGRPSKDIEYENQKSECTFKPNVLNRTPNAKCAGKGPKPIKTTSISITPNYKSYLKSSTRRSPIKTTRHLKQSNMQTVSMNEKIQESNPFRNSSSKKSHSPI